MDYSDCDLVLGLVCNLYKYTYDIDYSAVDGIHTCEILVNNLLGTQSTSCSHRDLTMAKANAIIGALRKISINYPKVLKAQSLKDRAETQVVDAPKTSKDDLSTETTVESSKVSSPPQVSTPATSSSQADLTRETSLPVDLTRETSLPVDLTRETSLPVDLTRETSLPVDLTRETSLPVDLTRETSLPVDLTRETSLPVDLTRETSLPVDFSKISPPLPMTRNHLGGNPGNILVISHKVCIESRYEHGVIHVLSNDVSMVYDRLNLSPSIKQYWKEQLKRTKANESLISYRINDFLIACHKEIREYIQANEIKTVLLEFPHINTALLQDCGAFGSKSVTSRTWHLQMGINSEQIVKM